MEKKNELTKKQINNLIIIGYTGIVIAYGLLLYVKMKHEVK